MDDQQVRAALERHHSESYGWALCCCRRDPARAEDALQRTYLKVLDGTARYAGRGSFKTWLFAVIRRTAADERRRDLLRRLRLVRYASAAARRDPAVASAAAAEEAASDADDLRAAFLAALDQLPARQRQVLHLLYYHELTVAEAAEVMRVSVGSARTHYDRGKKALRKRLQKERDDEPGRTPRPVPVVVW
jgi:RNA polymerase sigma-70 factor (ECF subfamily)